MDTGRGKGEPAHAEAGGISNAANAFVVASWAAIDAYADARLRCTGRWGHRCGAQGGGVIGVVHREVGS